MQHFALSCTAALPHLAAPARIRRLRRSCRGLRSGSTKTGKRGRRVGGRGLREVCTHCHNGRSHCRNTPRCVGMKGTQNRSRNTRSGLSATFAVELLVGSERFELSTSALSVLRSNQLSYDPVGASTLHHREECQLSRARRGRWINEQPDPYEQVPQRTPTAVRHLSARRPERHCLGRSSPVHPLPKLRARTPRVTALPQKLAGGARYRHRQG